VRFESPWRPRRAKPGFNASSFALTAAIVWRAFARTHDDHAAYDYRLHRSMFGHASSHFVRLYPRHIAHAHWKAAGSPPTMNQAEVASDCR
jgi:hypothetical protein